MYFSVQFDVFGGGEFLTTEDTEGHRIRILTAKYKELKMMKGF